MKVVEAVLTRVSDGLGGSEGPVFDTRGRFYAVAPAESAPEERSVLRRSAARAVRNTDARNMFGRHLPITCSRYIRFSLNL